MKLAISSEILAVFDEICSLLAPDACYLVGGIVRDTLYGKKSHDIDIATSCHPKKVREIFPDCLYFPKYGTTSFKKDGFHVTIASLRKETSYLDYRHPSEIEFIKDIHIDYLRRDFTINALYATSSLDLLDPSQKGIADLKDGIIRVIGRPEIRFLEDPLRIIRAKRFSLAMSFSVEKEAADYMMSHLELLRLLKPSKIKEEVKKCPSSFQEELKESLSLSFAYLKESAELK